MRYEEYLKNQKSKIKEFGLIDSASLPEIDLYIDQVSTFLKQKIDAVDETLSERYITKPMINNYAKKGLIARPDGKKYSSDHMLMILMVVYLRGIFKMEDISKIMKPLIENHNSEFEDTIHPADLYDTARSAAEKHITALLSDVDEDVEFIKRRLEDTDLADDDRMEIFTLILTLAMRADAEKYLASRLMNVFFKDPENEKEEKAKKPGRSRNAGKPSVEEETSEL